MISIVCFTQISFRDSLLSRSVCFDFVTNLGQELKKSGWKQFTHCRWQRRSLTPYRNLSIFRSITITMNPISSVLVRSGAFFSSLASMNLSELLEEPSRLEVKVDSLEREIQNKAIEQNEVFEKAQSCFTEVVSKVDLAVSCYF